MALDGAGAGTDSACEQPLPTSRSVPAMITIAFVALIAVMGAANAAAQRRFATHPGVETWPRG